MIILLDIYAQHKFFMFHSDPDPHLQRLPLDQAELALPRNLGTISHAVVQGRLPEPLAVYKVEPQFNSQKCLMTPSFIL